MTETMVSDEPAFAPTDVVRLHHNLLADEVAALGVTARDLPQLSAAQARSRIDAAMTYLHDDVLRHAHAEELALLPLLEHGGGCPSPMRVEHDTLREAVGQLRGLTARPLTVTVVSDAAGLLAGIALLLDGHFAREADVYSLLLERLDAAERRRLASLLVALEDLHPNDVRWLPEMLPAYQPLGAAGLLEPEGLVGSSCDPHVLTLVRSALAANAAGVTAVRWRTVIRTTSRYRRYLPRAQECMHRAGLWPWGVRVAGN